MNERLIVASALVVALAHPAEAQRWRTLEASRQVHDTSALSVRVEYSAGRFDLRPATGNTLYNMSLRYDASRGEAVSRYDSLARSLTVGAKGNHSVRVNLDDNDGGDLKLQLAPNVPMDLALELGAVEGELQLGGMALSDLSIKGGAAEITVRFDAPNRVRMHVMNIEIGAASVKLMHAANAGAERIKANVGVGSLDLDLSGPLTHDVEINASLAMGDITLRVAPEVGVMVEAKTFLGDMHSSGLIKRGDYWYSADYDAAPRKVRVQLKAFLGGFKLRRAS